MAKILKNRKRFEIVNFEMKKELYEDLGIADRDEKDLRERIAIDEKYGYLTENRGRDGNYYYVYFDEVHEGAISLENGKVISDEKELEKLFY